MWSKGLKRISSLPLTVMAKRTGIKAVTRTCKESASESGARGRHCHNEGSMCASRQLEAVNGRCCEASRPHALTRRLLECHDGRPTSPHSPRAASRPQPRTRAAIACYALAVVHRAAAVVAAQPSASSNERDGVLVLVVVVVGACLARLRARAPTRAYFRAQRPSTSRTFYSISCA